MHDMWRKVDEYRGYPVWEEIERPGFFSTEEHPTKYSDCFSLDGAYRKIDYKIVVWIGAVIYALVTEFNAATLATASTQSIFDQLQQREIDGRQITVDDVGEALAFGWGKPEYKRGGVKFDNKPLTLFDLEEETR